MTSDFKTIQVTQTDERVLRVQLNRPNEGNALSMQVLTDLLDVLTRLEDDRTTRVLVLSGAGEHFCQGGDRREFASMVQDDPSGGSLRAYGEKALRVCEALERLKILSVAQVHGDVIGAGIGLAVFCDLRVGATDSRFRMPEVVLGLPPAWGGILDRLEAECGQAAVREALLTAAPFDAERAQAISILQKVVPREELEGAVAEWVKPAARRNVFAMQMTKEMLNARARARRASVGSHHEPSLLAFAYLHGRGAR